MFANVAIVVFGTLRVKSVTVESNSLCMTGVEILDKT